jgi:Na+-driven multidrug efflux pump
MIFRVVARFGPHVVAALGIGMRIVQTAGLPIVGIGIATTTLVGQNLGAMKKDRAQETAVRSMLLSFGLMIAATIFFFFKAEALIRIFNDDPAVIREGTLLLKTVSGYLVLVGLILSMAGVFRGSGDTKPPMFGGSIRLLLLLTLAPFLSKIPQLGVQGVWFSMVISYGIETLFLGLWFRRGRWRDKRIELLETH